ncbi:MAG: signal peptidase I [Victivallaceae bacterium]|nr:signal peptidase I [Victivallaceae bacterium]
MAEKERDARPLWRRFLVPKFTMAYMVRLLIVAVAAVLVFTFVCRPYIIDGSSMKPTYPDSGFMLSNEMVFWFRDPKIGEVVIARANKDTSYLKRVVGTAGDRIQWRAGVLYRNGEPVSEPYVNYPCDWNTEEIVVQPGHTYVVGDNRSMPQSAHRHGQVINRRITGVPLW